MTQPEPGLEPNQTSLNTSPSKLAELEKTLNPGVVPDPRRLEQVASVASAKRETSKNRLSCCCTTFVQGSKRLISLLEATDENI